MAMTKDYIDTATPAKYLGGYSEGNPEIPEDAVAIDAPPPLHASQTTTDEGMTWSAWP